MLRKNFFTAEQIIAILNDYHNAGLPEDEVAIMEFAEKVAGSPNQVTQADFDNLKGYGLTDEEILDVILATSMRSFFSKVLDALGAESDLPNLNLEPELAQALAIGRPQPVSK